MALPSSRKVRENVLEKVTTELTPRDKQGSARWETRGRRASPRLSRDACKGPEVTGTNGWFWDLDVVPHIWRRK